MKTKRQIRQWLLFFVLVAIALYLHVQYPVESVMSPAPDESTDMPDMSNADPARTALPKAALPSKPDGLRGAHANTDTAA